MFYHCLQGQKKVLVLECKLRSVIKKKLSKLMDKELHIDIITIPHLNIDLVKNGQAFRPLIAMVAGSCQHFTLLNLKENFYFNLGVKAGFESSLTFTDCSIPFLRTDNGRSSFMLLYGDNSFPLFMSII